MNPPDPQDLPILIRLLRSLHDWSLEDLAAATRLDSRALSRYEEGTDTPSPEVLVRIADGVGLSAAYLDSVLIPLVHMSRELAHGLRPPLSNRSQEAAGTIGRELGEAARLSAIAVLSGVETQTFEEKFVGNLRSEDVPDPVKRRKGAEVDIVRVTRDFYRRLDRLWDSDVGGSRTGGREEGADLGLEGLSEDAEGVALFHDRSRPALERLRGFVMTFMTHSRKFGELVEEGQRVLTDTLEALQGGSLDFGFLDEPRLQAISASLEEQSHLLGEAIDIVRSRTAPGKPAKGEDLKTH